MPHEQLGWLRLWHILWLGRLRRLVEVPAHGSAILHILSGQQILEVLSKREAALTTGAFGSGLGAILMLLLFLLGKIEASVNARLHQLLARFWTAVSSLVLPRALLLGVQFPQAFQDLSIELLASSVELILEGSYRLFRSVHYGLIQLLRPPSSPAALPLGPLAALQSSIS